METKRDAGQGRGVSSGARPSDFLWSGGAVLAATGCFWLVHGYVDKGQASLLYLPVVIACAIRFGFGPAVLAAVLSFVCWNFFFLLPEYTLVVHDPKDLLSLVVFLAAAITTAQLAVRAQREATQARAREAEMATLFKASEAISREVSAARLLTVLAHQLQDLCQSTRCVVLRYNAAAGTAAAPHLSVTGGDDAVTGVPEAERERIMAAAERASYAAGGPEEAPAARLGRNPERDNDGLFLPLHAADSLVGVLHVGPRKDGEPYTPVEERLILTLANHAATVLARERLSEEAAQAAGLREADALKDALLSLVSHELRTPLSAIKASASGLLQKGSRWEEESRREALQAIDREADRLAGLVDHLLDLSRLEAGAWQPNKDWCDLADLTASVLDRLPESVAARVAVEIPADLPLVRVDYVQVALVLQNLLENAAKYAAPAADGAPIEVGARLSDKGRSILVTVRDFGEGITPGEEAQIFTRFFRGARHRGGGGAAVHGTGLGLALCEAVVRAHGGVISARNAAPPEKAPGAVFAFTLPVGLEEAP